MSLILVGEPSDNLRRDMSEMLLFEGFEVITASDANTALRMVYDHRPDLIICEMGFGNFDGTGFLKAIRADSTIAATPFVFCTPYADLADGRKAMFLGADDWLTKPFTAYDLVLTAIIHLHRAEIIKSVPRTELDTDIFVNYISTDREIVQKGVDRLKRVGFSLVLAEDRLNMDDEAWKNTIALLRRSRCMVSLISTESKMGHDRNFWSQFEMRIAHLIGIPIFLVHVSGDEKDIPFDLKHRYRTDARENRDEALDQLIDRIKKYIAYIKALEG